MLHMKYEEVLKSKEKVVTLVSSDVYLITAVIN